MQNTSKIKSTHPILPILPIWPPGPGPGGPPFPPGPIPGMEPENFIKPIGSQLQKKSEQNQAGDPLPMGGPPFMPILTQKAPNTQYIFV